MLKERLKNKETGYLFYGLTPPKQDTDGEKIKTIAQTQIERIKALPIDALVLYDVQDETSRISAPRPFPYSPMLSPDVYNQNYLEELDIPKIIYKSVSRFDKESFKEWISKGLSIDNSTVFVGAPSQKQATSLSLKDAYALKNELNPKMLLGGVTIPERHLIKKDEHIRVFDKIDNGCGFFISQCVYNLDNTKSFISDYYYHSINNNKEMAPLIFTLTPCGSFKTLEFMHWLGIDIPRWLKNDLYNSKEILAKSIEVCTAIAKELITYCNNKGIPMGFNIESVAIRKTEIDASIELVHSIKKLLEK